MATTAISLHLRPNRRRFLQNPCLLRFYSSTPDDDESASSAPPQYKSTISSYLSDVKASLKQSASPLQRPPPPPSQQQQPRFSFSPNQSPSRVPSVAEIRKNLSEFRLRSAAPPPPTPSSQERYNRNFVPKTGDTGPNSSSAGTVSMSLESIKQGLKALNLPGAQNKLDGPKMTPDRYKDVLKLRPLDSNSTDGSGQMKFPVLFEGGNKPDSDAMMAQFGRTYSYKELGERLRQLRPEVKGKNWFSLAELNERLKKLRKLEQKESKLNMGIANSLRESLVKLQSDFKQPGKAVARSHFDGTPSYMLSPPKEKLVEKYFHPDNMSSSEKLKVELKKVRDEFKISESDCGSARVQVAQLTTKIKHLSSALHKKDKHSRKGLQDMVQRRKKLLKYLRRTDWDSYCYVLSKLGLRDNPDYKS